MNDEGQQPGVNGSDKVAHGFMISDQTKGVYVHLHSVCASAPMTVGAP